jgi:hypothetical protein
MLLIGFELYAQALFIDNTAACGVRLGLTQGAYIRKWFGSSVLVASSWSEQVSQSMTCLSATALVAGSTQWELSSIVVPHNSHAFLQRLAI